MYRLLMASVAMLLSICSAAGVQAAAANPAIAPAEVAVLRLQIAREVDLKEVTRVSALLDAAATATPPIGLVIVELQVEKGERSAVRELVIALRRAAERGVKLAGLYAWPNPGPWAVLIGVTLPQCYALEGCGRLRGLRRGGAGLLKSEIEEILRAVGTSEERLEVLLPPLAALFDPGLSLAVLDGRATLALEEPGAEVEVLARADEALDLEADQATRLGLFRRILRDRNALLEEVFGLSEKDILWISDPRAGQGPAAAPSRTSRPRRRPAGKDADTVVVITVRDEVDDAMVAHIRRGLDRARELSADLVVLDIDTLGGAVVSMWRITEDIAAWKAEGGAIVAYVRFHAISAGMVIALSCGEIQMRENSSIGASTPVTMGPGGIEAPGDKGRSDSAEKIMSVFRAELRKLAQQTRKNRPNAILLAEAMVDRQIALVAFESRVDGKITIYPRKKYDALRKEGELGDSDGSVVAEWDSETLVTLTHEEALRYGFADGVVPSLQALLEERGLGSARIVEIAMSWSEDLVRFLDGIRFLIFLAACVLAYVEFKMPGFGVPGILSILCFALLLFGNYLMGLAEIPEIALFFVGVGLIAVELFLFPGTVFFGLGGGICVLIGLVLSFQRFAIPASDIELEVVRDNAYGFLGGLGITAVFALVVGRYFPHLPLLGRLVSTPSGPLPEAWRAEDVGGEHQSELIGREGKALTDLHPAGKVRLDGKVLNALSNGRFIEAGHTVKVIDVQSHRITVIELRGEEES